jgi:hypothetical protein
MDPKSTKANEFLIYMCNNVLSMYKEGGIDPFTGAPVSKRTMQAAKQMIEAFTAIEAIKAKKGR